MKPLKVAVVTDALYPWHKGGKEVRYLHLLQTLPEHGFDVVVYSMKWWDKTPDVTSFENGSLAYKAICPVVPMYKGTRRSIPQALLFAAATLRLLTQKFDVIEADHMPYLQLFPLRFIAWIKRVPLIITWHEVWGKEGWQTYLGPVGAAAALVEGLSMRLPNAIVAVSPGTSEKLIAGGARRGRVFVAPNALDMEAMQKSTAEVSAPELLFVGRLIEHKHADLAVEALGKLRHRGLSVRMGIVGVGPEEDRLRAQVATLGLESHVTFYGTLESQEELWSLIQGSQVLMAPSVREGFGLVVAEALALGTPVICAIHPENESANLITSGTGSLVPAFDAGALADAAELWLATDSLRGDRISEFLSDHLELTAGGMSATYAEIFRSASRR
jgi:glycosyltransferase involved in cell wall biosynthesis